MEWMFEHLGFQQCLEGAPVEARPIFVVPTEDEKASTTNDYLI